MCDREHADLHKPPRPAVGPKNWPTARRAQSARAPVGTARRRPTRYLNFIQMNGAPLFPVTDGWSASRTGWSFYRVRSSPVVSVDRNSTSSATRSTLGGRGGNKINYKLLKNIYWSRSDAENFPLFSNVRHIFVIAFLKYFQVLHQSLFLVLGHLPLISVTSTCLMIWSSAFHKCPSRTSDLLKNSIY